MTPPTCASLHEVLQLVEDVGVGAGVDAGEARHEELADHLVERQLLERRVDPALRVAIERRLRLGDCADEQRGHHERDRTERGTTQAIAQLARRGHRR